MIYKLTCYIVHIYLYIIRIITINQEGIQMKNKINIFTFFIQIKDKTNFDLKYQI